MSLAKYQVPNLFSSLVQVTAGFSLRMECFEMSDNSLRNLDPHKIVCGIKCYVSIIEFESAVIYVNSQYSNL